MIATTMYFGVIPNPNATTSPGATAMIGVTLSITASGITARSTRGISDMTTARAKAITMAALAPTAVSFNVVSALRK